MGRGVYALNDEKKTERHKERPARGFIYGSEWVCGFTRARNGYTCGRVAVVRQRGERRTLYIMI